jgi:hypothetical protein
LASRIVTQADWCARLGSPFYAALMHRAAADLLAGGPVADVLAGREDNPGPSALTLRLFGVIHRIVLDGRAPALARFYPSVGGVPDIAAAWPAFLDVVRGHAAEIRAGLDQPPQTNEVGRAAALVGGLRHAVAAHPLPVRLAEIGASAGLNLRADAFRILALDGSATGPADSPVVLRDAWQGRPPPRDGELQIVERIGCDLAPVDPATRAGRLRLMSYVWPEDLARLDRLEGALDVAERIPATVVASSAADFLGSFALRSGTVLVLWHSIMWQYLDSAERAAVAEQIDRLGGAASDEAPFAHLAFEPQRPAPNAEHVYAVMLTTWPGGVERFLGTAPPHGVPVTWAPAKIGAGPKGG